MLLTFLYHRVNKGKYANDKEMMKSHLLHLAKNYKIIVPGDKISFFKKNVCISFDDAYFDFYHYVYPLLKELNIKAILAVPIRFIIDKTNVSAEERLAVPYHLAMKDDVYIKKVPFCTWEEIIEMSNSGHVDIACHSYNHKNLLDKDVDLNKEIIESKILLEKKINKKVSTFIYPLGKFNKQIHNLVKKHYKYAMRIGSTWNLSWQNTSGITYRIISDSLSSIDQYLSPKYYISYLWFYLLNSFRRR